MHKSAGHAKSIPIQAAFWQLYARAINASKLIELNCMSTVGPKITRPACHMQPTMRTARRCTALLHAAARAAPGTDGRTDGHDTMRDAILTSAQKLICQLNLQRNGRRDGQTDTAPL